MPSPSSHPWRGAVRLVALVGALVVALVVALVGCSTGPSDTDARAVRSSVVTWFRAVQIGDVDAVTSAMSSTCPAGTAALLIESFRAAASAGLQDASVGEVDVITVEGDTANARITLDLEGTFGSGASDPGAFALVREDGRWVISC
jgi:ketosteroid isomerase-like protein